MNCIKNMFNEFNTIMKICNGTFDAETPELADIFARWPFPLSDFQKFAIEAIRQKTSCYYYCPYREW